MNNGLFNVIINSIKVRFIAITSRLRMWLNPSFIKTRVFGRIRQFFVSLFDVKPRHKDDYYKVMGYLISKRLAFAIVIVAGALSLCYLAFTNKDLFSRMNTGGIKTYDYNSLPLRFAKGEVRIRARKGYIAYQGSVKGGGCNGNGSLYNETGGLVYQGNFVNNKYNGHGTSYHLNGARSYTGDFYNNLYDGLGKAYRESGSILYDGSFMEGLKEGEGQLYDEGANLIYSGRFSADKILYSELLGKTAAQVRNMYTGVRQVYSNTDTGDSMVMMPQIDALYRGRIDEESTSDDLMVEEVYVIADSFTIGKQEYKNVDGIMAAWGTPSYQGVSRVTPGEAMIINYLNEKTDIPVLNGRVPMDTEITFSDFWEVSNIDPSYQVYIYSFTSDGLVYTFVCKDNDGIFGFYSITVDNS